MSARAAWREPMLWLVLALPLAVLAAAALMIVRAAGGTDAAAADVRRMAQVQTEDLAADVEAARLGLRGELRLRAGELVLRVPAAAQQGALRLYLEHPVHAARDRDFEMTPRDGEWRAAVDAFDTGHAWIVRASDMQGHWRVQGRWPTGASSAALVPAVAH